ncbi:hypothetical protein [Vibrio sp. M260112]|uniref:hypothetical protein n=1 Tax=Vibrio sp. M260112 TaxID=3020895 RepID=UPI002F409ABD
MSGTKNATPSKKPRATKPANGDAPASMDADKAKATEEAKQKALDEAEAKSAADAKAKQDKDNADAEALSTKEPANEQDSPQPESDSSKPEEVESDKPEQPASMADSDTTVEGASKDDVLDSEKVTDGDIGEHVDVLGILGAFKVRAKSDQGFWRSGVKFRRLQETVVLVVDEEPKDQPEILAAEDIDPEFVVFMSAEKAQRVHREPNLVIEDVELEDVIDIKQ